MKKLKQAILSMWFEGSDPNNDPADEEAGVMSGSSLQEVQNFACMIIAAHWNGECLCQTDHDVRPADARPPA